MRTKHLIRMLFPAAILILIAGTLNPQLRNMRQPINRLPTIQDGHNLAAPPPIISTVAFAGLRCLAADLLWLRASSLQDNGRYFELVQLADWITELEPHFKEVWAVHAWNMAYNISVLMPNDHERWRWVENGITLLRDRGIPANAADPYLYTELGFIFLDKIANPTDPTSQELMRTWAQKMMQVIGESGYPDYAQLETNKKTRNLLRKYKLIPNKMREIDQKYGPLDWRIPQAHALYWAYLGNTATGTNIHNTVCDRMIYDAMTSMFNYGKLTYSKKGDLFVTSVNFELLPKVISTFEDTLAHSDSQLPEEAYANFLGSAVRTLKFYHHDKHARELFDKLATQYPSKKTAAGFEAYTQHAQPTLPQILAPKK